jgi:hypothetical protein
MFELPNMPKKKKKFGPFKDKYEEGLDDLEPIEEDPDIAEFDSILKGRPKSSQRYQEHLVNEPRREDHKGNKLLAILTGALTGLGSRNPVAAFKSSREVMERPYNEAKFDFESKGKNLNELANIEEDEFDNDVDAFKTKQGIKSKKADDKLQTEKFEYEKGRDVIGDERYKTEFDNKVKNEGIDNAIAWHQANTARMNADTNRLNADTRQDALTAKTDPVERKAVFDDLRRQVTQAQEIINRRTEKGDVGSILGLQGKVAGGGDKLAFGEPISSLTTAFHDEDASVLNQIFASLLAHRGFKEGGKALTGPELQIFQNILPSFSNKEPKVVQKALNDFIQHINVLEGNSGGTGANVSNATNNQQPVDRDGVKRILQEVKAKRGVQK